MATSTGSSKKSKKLFGRKRSYSDSKENKEGGTVLHEGWAIKESGGAMFGKTNWRKRWFRLVQRSGRVTLEYYRNYKDKLPAGYVHLDFTYCTRPVESHTKPYPNCFAVGPLLEDGATRTYYISCSDHLTMQEWIAVIDAAIQGVPEQAMKRRQTVNRVFASRYKEKLKEIKERRVSQPLMESLTDESLESPIQTEMPVSLEAEDDSLPASMIISDRLNREDLTDEEMMDEIDDDIMNEESSGANESSPKRIGPDVGLTIEQKRDNYNNPTWRLEQWQALCARIKTAPWLRADTKDGVTVARCKFGRSSMGHAVMKIEGILPAEPKNVYQFLKLSTREGGKLDYLFRNEYLVEKLAGEPESKIIYNELQPPLPRVTKRDIVAMKIWVSPSLLPDGKAGMVMLSVDHPDVPPPESGYTRISLDISGFVLSPCPGPNNTVHTKMTVMCQIAFGGAMHKMLKGAYNSGLLKLGFRTTFSVIAEQLEKYTEITNI